MALSRITKVAPGGTNTFAVAFALGYGSEADITARVGAEVDGLGDPAYRTINFDVPGFMTLSGATVTAGTHVVFERTENRTTLDVDWSDGANLTDENLDAAQLQALRLIHEVADGRFEEITQDLDMHGHRIVNVDDPEGDGDAANKAYVDERIATGYASAESAAASASTATTQAGIATAQAAIADAQADISTAQAVISAEQAAIAAGHAETIGGLVAVYDPNSIEADAFNVENHFYSLDIPDAPLRQSYDYIKQGKVNAFDIGLPSDGSANMSPGFKKMAEYHGSVWVPECNVNIPEIMSAELTNHLEIEFHPKTKIVAGADYSAASLIKFTVPAGGVGIVPTERIILRITGGFFNSQGMLNPESIPFRTYYPANAERPGVTMPTGSNTVFSPLGTFSSGGRDHNGFSRVEVDKSVFWAGPHWRIAGGDSMIGAGEGVDLFIVTNCDFYGPRDTAIYGLIAGEGDAVHPRSRLIVRNSRVHNGFGLVSAKRSIELVAENNEGFNSVGVIGVSGSAYDKPQIGAVIRGNMGTNCMRVVEVVMAQGATITDNYMLDYGALLDDGTRVINIYGENFPFVFAGIENSTVRNNRARGKEPTQWSAQTVKLIDVGATVNADTDLIKTEKTTFVDNAAMNDYVTGYNYASLGREQENECAYNVWDGNRVEGTGSHLLDFMDPTSVFIHPESGMSFNYRDVVPAAPHTGVTGATLIKSFTIDPTEVNVGDEIRVTTEATVSVGANGAHDLNLSVGGSLFLLSGQTAGQTQDMGGVVILKKVSSAGWTIQGVQFEEGGTSGSVAGRLNGIGSSPFVVGTSVNLAHASDSVVVQSLTSRMVR